MIKTICFDLFGTLLEPVPQGRHMRAALRNLEPEKRRLVWNEMMTKCNLDYAWVPESLRADVAEEILLATTRVTMSQQGRDLKFEAAMTERKAVFCSNLSEEFVAPAVKALSPHFETGIASCEAGVRKPDPQIYQLVCDAMQQAPEEILFVGDSW